MIQKKEPSYYRVVVYKLLSKSCATLLGMLWIGAELLPRDGFQKAPTTAPCWFVNQLDTGKTVYVESAPKHQKHKKTNVFAPNMV